MKLPKIDLSALPDLDTLIGIIGSRQMPGSDDSVVMVMTFLYESCPPPPGG